MAPTSVDPREAPYCAEYDGCDERFCAYPGEELCRDVAGAPEARRGSQRGSGDEFKAKWHTAEAQLTRVREALHNAEVAWRSETDGRLDPIRLAELQGKYVVAALAEPAAGDAKGTACQYPHCHMRDSQTEWEGSPEWQRTRTNTSVESAALASEGHAFTGGAERSSSAKVSEPAAGAPTP